MENNFKNCLIFRENKLSSTNLREQIIHYIIITKYLYIPTHRVGLRLVTIKVHHILTKLATHSNTVLLWKG